MLNEEEEFKLIEKSLVQEDAILRLATNSMGEHILEEVIVAFEESKREYLFAAVLANFKELATDKQGLCVMKKLIEHTKNPSH